MHASRLEFLSCADGFLISPSCLYACELYRTMCKRSWGKRSRWYSRMAIILRHSSAILYMQCCNSSHYTKSHPHAIGMKKSILADLRPPNVGALTVNSRVKVIRNVLRKVAKTSSCLFRRTLPECMVRRCLSRSCFRRHL